MMKNKGIIFGFIGIIINLLCCASLLAQDSTHVDSISNQDRSGQTKLSIIGVGDMMLGTNFPDPRYLPPSPGSLLAPVKDTLKKADVTFGNLEASLMDSGELVKDCEVDSLCYAFRMPTKFVRHFKEAGFDFISLANNHSGDFGTAGRKRTVKTLSSAGIKAAGLNFLKTNTLTVKGKTLGLVAFSPNNGTPRIEDIPKAKKLVNRLDQKVDITIVSFHGGAEGKEHQHVTREEEEYYGENRGNVYKFAHSMIDEGADVIFGHGPHVPRAIELYKDRFIAYSLGNFCTYARFNVSGVNGLAPMARIQVNEEGEFLQGRIISAIQKGEGGAENDPTHEAARKIRELTREDFPETPIKIEPNGQLKKKGN